MEAFLKNPGRTLPRAVLLSRVWGPDAEVERGLELQRVFARRDILDEEITPLIGHHGHVARRHRNLHGKAGTAVGYGRLSDDLSKVTDFRTVFRGNLMTYKLFKNANLIDGNGGEVKENVSLLVEDDSYRRAGEIS